MVNVMTTAAICPHSGWTLHAEVGGSADDSDLACPCSPSSSPGGQPRAPQWLKSASRGCGISFTLWKHSHDFEFCRDRKPWTLAKLASPACPKITHRQMMFMAEQSHRRETQAGQVATTPWLGKCQLGLSFAGEPAPNWATAQFRGEMAPDKSSACSLLPKQSQPALLAPGYQRTEIFSFHWTQRQLGPTFWKVAQFAQDTWAGHLLPWVGKDR